MAMKEATPKSRIAVAAYKALEKGEITLDCADKISALLKEGKLVEAENLLNGRQ